jgi:uncharacterized protein YecE (DUF72 family)
VSTLRIGTSGWHYDSWIGPFYPADTRKKDLLRVYAERFSTTEINASFYRLPSEQAVRNWRNQVPDGFLFAVKGSRFVTHNKKLKEPTDSIRLFEERLALLGDRRGPTLWQLPPNLKRDDDRLGAFLKALPPRPPQIIEFRNPDWYAEPVFELLSKHKASLCISDHADAPAPWRATADTVYIRGHGPGGRYAGSYSDTALADWADRIAKWRHAGHSVFCYFDNDYEAAAPADALRLIELAEARGLRVG